MDGSEEGYQSDVTTSISKAVPTEFCYHIRHTTGIGVVIGDESSCSTLDHLYG